MTARPEADWIQVDVPESRIVTDALWDAAHARLAENRATYLRSTGGKLWGHPLGGVAAKYLLTGLTRCWRCGGSLEVRSRSHGTRRGNYYGCSTYHRKRRAVCANRLEAPLPAADGAVIEG